MKLVSIIMPTYNREKTISSAINSVLAQTYDNFELIVVDDGSEDGTWDLIETYTDNRIKYYNYKKNRGACYARNYGIKQSQGEYIAFLDSDNTWDRAYLQSRIIKLEEKADDCMGVFGYTELARDGEVFAMVPSEEKANIIQNDPTNLSKIRLMLFNNIIDTNTIVLKRKYVEESKGFDEALGRLQDWEFFFRLLISFDEYLEFSDDCLVRNNIMPDSISCKTNDSEYWKTKLYFLKEYKAVFIENNVLAEAACEMICSLIPYAGRTEIEHIVDILDYDEIKEVISLLREKYEDIDKWRIEIQEACNSLSELCNRQEKILDFQERWMKFLIRGGSFASILRKMGYNEICIYGYGRIGRVFYDELKNKKFEITQIIDKNHAGQKADQISICAPDELTEESEVMIITAINDYEDISRRYYKRIKCISIEDLLELAEKKEGVL
ncbi:MAG: glycosyltransferase family 2 protein [Lachnospiraceae bacterium]|nr:glycosyltransferase family 2 protein [Lachnospiraceae bacterium]